MNRNFLTKSLAVILAGAMTVSMAACGSLTTGSSDSTGNTAAAETAASDSGTAVSEATVSASSSGSTGSLYPEITVALPSDWKDLSPVNLNQDSKPYFMFNIYETLFDIVDGKFVGNLAESYTNVDDKTMDVTIYDCIYDSDGNHITADDVVNSINWVHDSGNAIGYDYFESVEKKDDYTVEFHWTKKPMSMGVLEQIIARAAIFSTKAQGEHNFATDPVGTGDYKVTKCTTGSSMTMEARSDYWGNDPAIAAKRAPYHTATVQKINFQIISESAQAAIALETNKIDVCSYITADTLPEFQEGGQYAGNYQVIEAMASDYYQINPNGGSKFGSDENLMKAIYYALDNTSIAKAMGGSYIPAKAYGSSFFYDYDKSWESESNYINTYDPAKAKEFLSKSNYKGETLQMIGLSTEAVKNAMQMIQVQLLQVGINVNINAYDQNTMEATMGSKDGWDFVVSLTGGPSLVKSLGGYGNTINADNNNKYWVSDDQLQSLLDTANTDGTNDQEHLKAALDYIMDKGYGYVIADASSSIVATKKLTKMFMREGYYTVAASTYSNN